MELVTRRHPPPETIVNVALYSTSLTSVTERRPTPNAAATEASTDAVALRSAAGSLTRTTRAHRAPRPRRGGWTRAGPGQQYAPCQGAPRHAVQSQGCV